MLTDFLTRNAIDEFNGLFKIYLRLPMSWYKLTFIFKVPICTIHGVDIFCCYFLKDCEILFK